MITYVYFVRFKALRFSRMVDYESMKGLDYESVEGSLIMRREKWIGTNKDLEDVERYVARYVEGDVKKIEILVLNLLHGLSDIS